MDLKIDEEIASPDSFENSTTEKATTVGDTTTFEPSENGPKCDGCGLRYEKGDFPVAVSPAPGENAKALCRKCREPFVVKTKEEIAKIPIDGPNGNGIYGISMLAARA